MNIAVIGVGFGDEGKGLTVDNLTSKCLEKGETVFNVRYSGGCQCAHGVRISDGTEKGKFHEFRIFGSGSMRGASTILTKDVVFDPISMLDELLELGELVEEKIYKALKMYIDPRCPVTTPYEIWVNQHNPRNIENGTCGKGIFSTKLRERNNYHLWFKDLFYPEVLAMKLANIKQIYKFPVEDPETHELMDIDLRDFFKACERIVNSRHFEKFDGRFDKDKTYIFESSQGLLLDEEIGLFPNCTPSKLDLPEYINFDECYLVTRAYHSRHGNGYLPTANFPVKPNVWETNYTNPWQGEFRTGVLDLQLLQYAIESSNVFDALKVNLVITHLDIVENDWRIWVNGDMRTFSSQAEFVEYIIDNLPLFNDVYLNNSPFSGNLK